MSELLIAASSLTHITVHLKVKRLGYKILYAESLILFSIGLSGWIWFWSKNLLVLDNGFFTNLTDLPLFPLQPIDLIFMGVGLGGSTVLLDFLTRLYKWDRNGLLAVLPWTLVGTYRYLHEFVWVFSYWTTIDVLNKSFSDSPSVSLLPFQPAILTHSYAILFVLFTFFNFIVLLQESKRKNLID